MQAVTLTLFVLCLALLALTLKRWSRALEADIILASTRDGEWSRACILLMLRAYNDILGENVGFWRTFARTTLIALLLVGIFWPLAGWLSGKTLGFSGPPWQVFDETMELLQRTSSSQPSQALVHTWASNARLGVWKYVYAFGATGWISILSAGVFATCIVVSRFLLHEFENSTTWAQKAGLMLGLASFTLLLLILLTFLVGLIISPAPWLALLFTVMGLGLWADVALVIGANAFTFYFGDPWLKSLLLVCLFPCLLPLVITGSALALDIWRLNIRLSREKVLEVAKRRLGRSYVPFLMTATALYVAYWILSRLI